MADFIKETLSNSEHNCNSKLVAFLAYFPKMKVHLSNHESVCLSPANNLWTAW
jgi:hypothetical protein